MGMPEIVINFKEKKNNFIYRLGRGIVAYFVAETEKSAAEKHLIKFKRDAVTELAGLKTATETTALVERMFDYGARNVLVVVAKDFDTAKPVLEKEKYNYLAMEAADESALTWAKDINYRAGRKFMFVTDGAASLAKDDAHVVSVYPDSKTVKYGKVTDVAAICAGINDRSATYYKLADNSQLTDEELAKYPARKEAGTKVDEGAFTIYNDGEKIKVARAVTTYYKPDIEEPANDTTKSPFAKVRSVDILNMIEDDIRINFDSQYVGQVINSYENKMDFISITNAVYLAGLEGTALNADLENYVDIDLEKHIEVAREQGLDVENMSEIDLRQIDTGDKVYLSGVLHVLDSMEDLYINFSI